MPEDKSEVVSNPSVEITDTSIYQDLLNRSGGQFSGDPQMIAECEPICQRLHTLGTEMGNAYKQIAENYGLQPGRVDVVLGGGRAKGKPFKKDSDLDIFFYIENSQDPLDSIKFNRFPGDPGSAQDEQITKMQALVDRVKEVANKHGVANHFHIMGYGREIPEQYSHENELLLARVV